MSSTRWLEHPIFAAAGADACAELAATHPARAYSSRERIVLEGEPADSVYVLLMGSARAFHCREKQEVLVRLLRAPALFGEAEALGSTRFLSGLEVLSSLELALMPADEYRGFLERHPAAAAEAIRQLAALACAVTQQTRQLLASGEERLAAVLLAYARFAGHLEAEGVAVPRLSQERLSREAGLCRRAVAEVISRWRRQGLVASSVTGLVIHDLPALVILAAAGRSRADPEVASAASSASHCPQDGARRQALARML